MKLIKIMTCGSVDDGKSTLLGRLLYETNNLQIDQSEYLNKINIKYQKKDIDIDYSLLLDGLIDEKEQGITIDIAFKYFTLLGTQFTLIDSPGHKEYTKNMANAASHADGALILVDASKGVTTQTKKHIEIVNLFPNIQFKVICINKMDKVGYSAKIYKKLISDLNNLHKENSFQIPTYIPISAVKGDNLTTKSQNMRFYKGQTLLKVLTSLELKSKKYKNGDIAVKFINNSSGDRIYYVQNNNISYKVGDRVKNVYTNEVSKIIRIYYNNKTIPSQKNITNTAIQLSDQISITKGDTLVLEKDNSILTDSIKVKLVWIDNEKLSKSQRYIFKLHAKDEYGFFSKTYKKNITKNDIASAQVELENKIYVSDVLSNYYSSQLIIINPQNNQTVAFGFVEHNIDKGISIIHKKLQNFEPNKHKCIWLTGLPSSGKSTIAEALGKKLDRNNKKYYILDGDNLRSTINKDLGFSKEDRIENNRRIAHLAKILYESGLIPIVATISPHVASRDFAKSLFDEDEFSLVYIKTSLEECIRRDPKNLYASKNKKINNITGIHENYEIPKNPSLILDTEVLSINQSVNRIYKLFNF